MNAIYEEFRVALHMVWRRRWLALAVAWGICLVGWLVISLLPNKYESRAKVLVQMQSLLSSQVGITQNDTQRDIDHVRQMLMSNENLVKVVRSSDVARQVASDADVAAMVGSLAQGIKIVAQPDNLFEISAETSISGLSDAQNAKLSHDVVQKLVDLFIEGNAADDRAEAVRTLRFLNQEIQRREQGLRDAESRRVAFEQKYLGSMPGTGSIDQRADAIRAELAAMEPSLSSAQSSLAAMNAQMAGTPATVATPGVAGGGVSRAAALQAQLADAQARGWTDQHPDVITIRSQLARLGKSDGAAVSAGGSVNPLYMSLRSMQAEKQATASSLSARKAELQANLNALTALQIRQPDIVSEQARLSRDSEVLKAQYDKLMSDREEVRLRAEVNNQASAIQIRVMEGPSRPTLPSSPNRPLLLFAVLIVGIGTGVGAAWAQGQLRTTYSTADRLARATGLNVLGSIPETLNGLQIDARRQKGRWFAGGAGALGAALLLLLAIEFVQRGLMA
jgi:polysaccharide chain length determinant protein (PEP-CTERM system associated)